MSCPFLDCYDNNVEAHGLFREKYESTTIKPTTTTMRWSYTSVLGHHRSIYSNVTCDIIALGRITACTQHVLHLRY